MRAMPQFTKFHAPPIISAFDRIITMPYDGHYDASRIINTMPAVIIYHLRTPRAGHDFALRTRDYAYAG